MGRAALGLVLGRAETDLTRVSVLELAAGVIRAMMVAKAKLATAALLIVVALATVFIRERGRLGLAQAEPGRGERRLVNRSKPRAQASIPAPKTPDPQLPQHARVRLGTTQLRHSYMVSSVAFSSDGRTLASAGWDGAIRFWDLATGGPAANLPVIKESGPRREAMAQAVACSPDGRTLVIGRYGGLLQLWDQSAGKERFRSDAHKECLWGIAYATDSQTFATATDDESEIRIRDVATGRELRTLEYEGGPTLYPSLAFSPDGKWLALGASSRSSAGNRIHVWDFSAGAGLVTIRNAHGGRIVNLAFTSAEEADFLRLRRQASARPTGESAGRSEHSPDLHLGREDRATAPGARPGRRRGHVRNRGVAGRNDPGLGTSRSPSGLGSCLRAHHPLHCHRSRSNSRQTGTAGSPLRMMASLQRSSAATKPSRLWNLTNGRPLFHQENAHDTTVVSVAIIKDGGRLATGDDNGVIRIWEPIQASVVHRLELGERGRVSAVRFGPDGKTLAACGAYADGKGGSSHGIVRIWDLRELKMRRELRPEAPADLLEFSPNGDRVAVASDVIDFFNAATGRKELELTRPRRTDLRNGLFARRSDIRLGGPGHEVPVLGHGHRPDDAGISDPRPSPGRSGSGTAAKPPRVRRVCAEPHDGRHQRRLERAAPGLGSGNGQAPVHCSSCRVIARVRWPSRRMDGSWPRR